jgi:hypothetical protein
MLTTSKSLCYLHLGKGCAGSCSPFSNGADLKTACNGRVSPSTFVTQLSIVGSYSGLGVCRFDSTRQSERGLWQINIPRPHRLYANVNKIDSGCGYIFKLLPDRPPSFLSRVKWMKRYQGDKAVYSIWRLYQLRRLRRFRD